MLISLAVVAAGCIGTGEPRSSPSGSAADSPSPSAASPSPSPSTSALPAALAAKTWVTWGPVGSLGAAVAGTLDGRYHLTLPPAEVGLAAADFRVVSAIWTKGSDGSIESSTLIVRDLRQEGAEIARFEIPDAIVDAVIRGDLVYLAGSSARRGVISGVYAGSLADGSVRTLIAPGPVPDNLGASSGSVVFALQMGPGVSRGPVVLSPSGRTLGSAVCGNGRCNIELVDVASGKVSRPLTGIPAALWLLGETTLIGVDDTSVYGYDLSGGLRWSLKNKRPQSPGCLTSDGGRLVVLYQDLDPSADAVVILATVDVTSGANRELRRWGRDEPAPLLWAAVSTDETVVLIPNGLAPEAALDAGGGSFRADIVDIRTGTLTKGALLLSNR